MKTENIKIKIVDLVFENQIKDYEIEALRGALAHLVGFENTLFHNHIGETKLAYGYPLIQYKTRNGQASLTCIAQGVEELSTFFLKKDWTVFFSGKKHRLKIDTLNLRNGYFKLEDKTFRYTLKKWMPLNQINHKLFHELKNIQKKINLLEKILIGNVLSMAKSMDWQIKDEIHLSIEEVTDEYPFLFKKQKVTCFDIKFEMNVSIPINIGLGKGVSHGFGVIFNKTENPK